MSSSENEAWPSFQAAAPVAHYTKSTLLQATSISTSTENSMWEADTEKHKAASKCYRPHKSTVSDRLYATANVEIAAAWLDFGKWSSQQWCQAGRWMMHCTEHKNGNQPWSAACTYLSLVYETKKEDMRAVWAVRMVNRNFPSICRYQYKA